MIDMWLDYTRNYRNITEEERQIYESVCATEESGALFGKINHYNQYPTAVKHYLSLFPNNHIYLYDMKIQRDLHSLNEQFYSLIHNSTTTEREILRFINHNPKAYHIIGSIFSAGGFRFGHHEAYLFPEFRLGQDYIADYLLIGKSSGGFEFVFIELEKSSGRVTLKDGHIGQVVRSGENQITDWKMWIDANFEELKMFFDSEKQIGTDLPIEFYKYDSSRMHYVVVGGTREDYNDKTYGLRRRKEFETGVRMLHYDNLFDAAEALLEKSTF